MPDFVIVSEAARRLSVELGETISPRAISSLFYRRELRDDLCPIVGGRRMIPADYLPLIEAALRRHGVIRNRRTTGAAS